MTLPELTGEGILLPLDWTESEKGNTWLHNGDSQVLWIELVNNYWLEIEHSEGNSPYWRIGIILTDADRTWAHIHSTLDGWTVGRWNLPKPPREIDGVIVGDEEGEDDGGP
jgi:hypothetical protein